ncbi:lysophospholipid acyltransferase family protein [bacterium]|nr:lysophospholipid acyltransferase family protein [bacterium]
MTTYYLYKLSIFLVKTLPYKISYFIGRILINILFLFNKKDQEIVKKNFINIFGTNIDDKQLKKLIKNNFLNFAYYLIDFLYSPSMVKQNLDNFVKSENMDNIDKCLKYGKGVIISTAHIGNWELGGLFLAHSGYKMNAVALDHSNEKINNLFKSTREYTGLKNIPLGKATIACINALANNETLALLGDRIFDKAEKGITVEMFGKKTIFPRGHIFLSIKTGAPIVPGFLVAKGNRKYLIKFFEPIIPPVYNKETLSQDYNNIADKYIKAFEQMIMDYPDQWFAFENVWV